MAKLVLLGSGAALSDAHRENMYLVVQGERSAVLIDCAGSPIQRLLKARVELDSIDDVVLTHHHPDHLYGLPIFLMDLWLAGRKKVMHLHGLAETLQAARGLLDAFEWQTWHDLGFYPVEFHTIALMDNEIGLVLDSSEFSVSAARTLHVVPTIGLRIMSKKSGKTIVYSSDTEKCDAVIELARGADLLLHEATSLDRATIGHSSARQAGSQARHAGVKKLALVHLPPNGDVKRIRAAAERTFRGKVVVAKDYMRFDF